MWDSKESITSITEVAHRAFDLISNYISHFADTIRRRFEEFGKLENCRLVRDIGIYRSLIKITYYYNLYTVHAAIQCDCV